MGIYDVRARQILGRKALPDSAVGFVGLSISGNRLHASLKPSPFWRTAIHIITCCHCLRNGSGANIIIMKFQKEAAQG